MPDSPLPSEKGRSPQVPDVLWVWTDRVEDGRPTVVVMLRSDNQAGDEIVLTQRDVQSMHNALEFRSRVHHARDRLPTESKP